MQSTRFAHRPNSIGMKASRKRDHFGFFERLAERVSKLVATSWAFALAAGVVLAWAVLGPVFRFSDTWQLVINTSTTIITFLMVFLIQRSQNRTTEAVLLKLNELVAATAGASNRLIDVEDLSEQEMRTLHAHYRRLVEMTKSEVSLTASHSVEEAESRHARKRSGRASA